MMIPELSRGWSVRRIIAKGATDEIHRCRAYNIRWNRNPLNFMVPDKLEPKPLRTSIGKKAYAFFDVLCTVFMIVWIRKMSEKESEC